MEKSVAIIVADGLISIHRQVISNYDINYLG